MKRLDPAEGAKCVGVNGQPCTFGADAAHSFISITDTEVTSEDLCSECYECLHTGRE